MFDYLFPKSKSSRPSFLVDVYFVLPKRLGINGITYSKDDFYSAMKPLTRFSPPHLQALRESEGVSGLPHLDRLQQAIAEGARLMDLDVVVREARLFACAFVHRYARRSAKMHKLVRKKVVGLQVPKPNAKERLDRITEEIQSCYEDMEEFRVIVKHLVQRQRRITDASCTAFIEVDEYCTYRIREELLALKELFSSDADNALFKDLFAKIDATLATEREHASRMGYYWPMAESPAVVFEAFGRRRAFLKQSIWSVLFLDLRSSRLFRFQTHVGAMIAAGIAAAWALTAQIWVIQNAHTLNFKTFEVGGFLFVTAFVLAYVVKDRIKELGRARFRRGLMGRLPDTSESVWYNGVLGHEKNIGHFREWVGFQSVATLPDYVRKVLRSAEAKTVLHYRKRLRLDHKACRRALPYPVRGVHDIMRFTMDRFFQFVSESGVEALVPNASGGVVKIPVPKTYEVQMVVSRSMADSEERDVDALRLIFSRNGLIRCERIDAPNKL